MPLSATQLGGGTFSGRAIYGTNAFAGVKEDVSDFVSMVSPAETPLLNLLGDPEYPATNIWHQWQEESLNANLIIASLNVASTQADTYMAVRPGVNKSLQVGMILRGPEVSGGEYFQIFNITGTTVGLIRSFGGTTANSFAAGEFLTIVSDAAVDGADVLTDTSQGRPLVGNFTQIFKKDVIISGTMDSVSQHGGITSEKDTQITRRLKEAMRDLEKSVVLGILSGNTIGSEAASRTFKGLLSFLSTNKQVVPTTSIAVGIDTTNLGLFETYVNQSIQDAWTEGGTDLDLIICGVDAKIRFDYLNQSRVRAANRETLYSNNLTVYENTYGLFSVMLSRWMPRHTLAILATPRIKAVPLNGRSFHFEPVGKTGDAEKGMVIGEYSLEVKNQNAMAQVVFNTLAPGAGKRLIPAP